jgi:nucleotide-binding universal stress UspA family protein
MYRKVLLPLDGSERAECALTHVRMLAKAGLVGEVLLLHIVEIPADWLTENTDLMDLLQKMILRGEEYLAAIQADLEKEGIKATSELMEGRADETIIDYAKGHGVNLLVIASHGHTGIKHWVFGSVALRVLHDAPVPVLLIRPEPHRM